MEIQKIIFYSIGGLGIFLYGMTHLSEGLQKIAGSRMRNFIRAFTSNKFKGMLVGAGVTAVIQSSSITTIMLIGLLNAGVMTLQQSIGVVYGANIGTTVTAQIIAFKITHYALPMITLGFVMYKFIPAKKAKFIGQVVLSLGFIFLGLKFMKDAFVFMKDSEAVMQFCASLSAEPIQAILVGVILTVIVQSSSASLGITLVMATTGLIDFTASLYMLLGLNIGTTITAWLASIGSVMAARRMALVHSLFNVTGACYFGLLIYSGIYTRFIDWVTPGAITTETIGRHIANGHTAFNIFNALILFPFIGLFAWMAQKTFRGEEHIVTGEAKFIDNHLLETPEVAIEQVGKEIHHMALIAQQSFEKACESYITDNTKLAEEVTTLESAVDSLQQDITRYLVKLFSHSLSSDLSGRLPSLLHSVNDLEKVSDYAENIAQLTLKRKESNYPISEMDRAEVKEIYAHTKEMFNKTTLLLANGNTELGDAILKEEDQIDDLKKSYMEHQVERLTSKESHPLAGLAFVAFLNNVEKIGDHLTNVTEAALSHYAYDRGTAAKHHRTKST